MDQPLIGRAREREAIDAALASLRAGAAGLLVLEGEAGIGKSRLLGYVAAAEGCTVLEARASEYEADLPYALWTEALDRHLAAAGERRVSRLGLADAAALAGVLPALGVSGPAAADRHRTHRALRDLLERLAATRPLVVCLDDVHWADPASLDVLAALVHRPPAGPVLLAVAARAGQLPPALRGRDTRLRLGPLNEAEARELVGASADAVYGDSGGNPFYLEQLARGRGTAAAGGAVRPAVRPARRGDPVPPAVAAALAAELRGLAPDARRLLDAAAVIGDPFGPALAAETAELDEPAALAALDELLDRALVRPGGAPRRFAFRHPVVRHAVYEAAPGGWRLGAHARAAAALERRGAGPVERAHHVEQAASRGDEAAIALLGAAARELQSPAPATAARFHAAALRLLPDGAAERTAIEARLADAQAAAGDAAGARETLLGALRTAAPARPAGADRRRRERGVVARADARRAAAPPGGAGRAARAALAGPHPPAPRARPDRADELRPAARRATRPPTPPTTPARSATRCSRPRRSPAAPSRACRTARGPSRWRPAAAALERLAPEQLATRLPAFWMLGRSRRGLGQFERALADLERGAAIALETGRDNVRLQLTVERVATLIELGRPADATAAAEQGLELARLAGNPPMLLWAHCALSSARLAAGDVSAALAHAEEAAASGIRPDFHAAGQPGWCLGAALTAAGNPERAVAAMLDVLRRPDPRRRPAGRAPRGRRRPRRGPARGAATWTRPKRRSRRSRPRAGAPARRGRAPSRAHRSRPPSCSRRERPAEALAAAREARAAAEALPSRTRGRGLPRGGRWLRRATCGGGRGAGGGRGGARRLRRAAAAGRGGARAAAARPPRRARRAGIPPTGRSPR